MRSLAHTVGEIYSCRDHKAPASRKEYDIAAETYTRGSIKKATEAAVIRVGYG